jgi:hypothetical protein
LKVRYLSARCAVSEGEPRWFAFCAVFVLTQVP